MNRPILRDWRTFSLGAVAGFLLHLLWVSGAQTAAIVLAPLVMLGALAMFAFERRTRPIPRTTSPDWCRACGKSLPCIHFVPAGKR